jgi:hypothetical protein
VKLEDDAGSTGCCCSTNESEMDGERGGKVMDEDMSGDTSGSGAEAFAEAEEADDKCKG